MDYKAFINKENQRSCWWCGATELTGEHKFKKKDLERLYGKGVDFRTSDVNLIDYRSNKTSKRLQSAKSIFAQFEKSLCPNCNNSKSQPFDLAYDTLIEYYFANQEQITRDKFIDLSQCYGENWLDKKESLSKYIIKHIGCRLSEHNYLPFESTIDYLNGADSINHVKIILQIKQYNALEIPTIFKGPFILISHLQDRSEITSVCSWFTVKNITFNYIYEWDISNNKSSNLSNLPIGIVDFSTFPKKSFTINTKNLPFDFAQLIEELEFFPFTANIDELNIYNYFKNKI